MRGFAFAIVLVLLTGAIPARAAGNPLPEGVAAILQQAAIRDRSTNYSHYLSTALQLAIAAYPNRKTDILAYARTLAPDRASTLAAMAAPPLESIVVSATPPPKVPREPVRPSGFFSLEGWSGSLELGASANSGNTDAKAISAAFKLLDLRTDWRHKINGTFDWSQTSGVTTKDRTVLGYQLDYLFNDRLYGFGLGKYEDDRFSGFNWRATEALGVGYEIFRGANYALDLEGSVAVRQSRLSPGGPTQNEPGGRLNTVFYWNITDNLRLDNEATAVLTTQRTTLEDALGLQTKITRSISAKLSFQITHDSDVPLGTRMTDTTTRATVLYNF